MKLSSLMGGAFIALIAVLLAPAALGAVRPDDRADPRGPGAAVTAPQPVHPNDRASPLGPGGVALATAGAFWAGERDLGLYGPTGDIVVPISEPTVIASPSGFDWMPVVAGAGFAAAAALALGLFLATHRHVGGGGRPIPH